MDLREEVAGHPEAAAQGAAEDGEVVALGSIPLVCKKLSTCHYRFGARVMS